MAGSIGPLGRPAHGDLGIGDPAARAAFREQLDGLLEGGVDLLILETFHDLDQLLLAIDEVRAATRLPIIASMTFGEELGLADGRTPEAAAACSPPPAWIALGGQLSVSARSPRSTRSAGSTRTATGCPARSCRMQLRPRIEGQLVYAADPGLVRRGSTSRWPREPASWAAAAARRRPMSAALSSNWTSQTAAQRAKPPRPRRARSRTPLPAPSGTTRRPAIVETPRATPPSGNRGPGCRFAGPRPRSSGSSRREGRLRGLRGDRPARSIRIERTVEAGVSSRRPGPTASTSATRRWPVFAWVPSRSRSGSSATWTSSASSAFTTATGT